MSTGQMQVRNAELVRLLSGDLQLRYEPNFAWKSAVSAYLALPALRAFWPMSSVDYAAASRARDVSGSGYHLTDNNTPTFNYDSLAPYVEFDGSTQYLSRADGGAATWADITGTETYVDSGVRGLTVGGWFWLDSAHLGGSYDFLIGKDSSTPSRGYWLSFNANNRVEFQVSVDGTANVTVTNTTGGATSGNEWVFCAGRFDPSTELAAFKDDTYDTNLVGIPASVFDNTADFRIALRGNNTLYLDGRASMCFLCAADLSDAIILSLFHQTRAMFGV